MVNFYKLPVGTPVIVYTASDKYYLSKIDGKKRTINFGNSVYVKVNGPVGYGFNTRGIRQGYGDMDYRLALPTPELLEKVRVTAVLEML